MAWPLVLAPDFVVEVLVLAVLALVAIAFNGTGLSTNVALAVALLAASLLAIAPPNILGLENLVFGDFLVPVSLVADVLDGSLSFRLVFLLIVARVAFACVSTYPAIVEAGAIHLQAVSLGARAGLPLGERT